MEPAVAKGGMAVALSLGAGYFFNQLRSHQPITSPSGNPHRHTLLSSPDAGGSTEEEKKTSDGGVKNRVGVSGFEEAPFNFPRASIFGHFPPKIRPSKGDLSYTMEEFDELVQEEFGLTRNHENDEVVQMKQEITDLKKSIKSICDRETNLENQILELNNLRQQESVVKELQNHVKIVDLEIEELKQKNVEIGNRNYGETEEVAELKNRVKCSSETEPKLEIQMTEHNDLKEQLEALVMELESRLKIGDMEKQLSTVKLEAVENENKHLNDQVSAVKSELGAQRENIKILRRKIRHNSRLAKEKVSSLYRKIVELQLREDEILRHVVNVERNLERLKDLEDEVADLRKENSMLAQENLDLSNKLESVPATSSSAIYEVSEADDVREEMARLKQINEELTNQIQQIRTEQSADSEQAIYLRWINACLRYELRNYQPPPGKISARDLNKNPSLRSAQKAKELILQHANSINEEEIRINLQQWSFSPPPRSPTATDVEEIVDDISIQDDHLANYYRRPKFLGKLKKMVFGKHTHIARNSSPDAIKTTGVDFESSSSNSTAEVRIGGKAKVGVTTDKTEVQKLTSSLKNSSSPQCFCRS